MFGGTARGGRGSKRCVYDVVLLRGVGKKGKRMKREEVRWCVHRVSSNLETNPVNGPIKL